MSGTFFAKRPWLLALAAPIVVFGLLEGLLGLIGIQPIALTEDPYMGFAHSQPLFIKQSTSDGQSFFVTNPAKIPHFNLQSFPEIKGPNTYRIFCVGGSTTYGHPYRDLTSYCGWLRAILKKADPSRQYEVINAGGISYASYREAELVRELCAYQPDLFLVYSGHNEFLEERTYRNLTHIPALIREISATLDKTRIFSVLRRTVRSLTGNKKTRVSEENKRRPSARILLAGEVDDVLAKTIGPTSYVRNDALKKNVIEHFAFSLRRMERLARLSGAKILFMTTPSNERNCSPFKSENTPGLQPDEIEKSIQAYQLGLRQKNLGNDSEAYKSLHLAAELNPRHAALQYEAGLAALQLKKNGEAMVFLQRALEEDICPLRALNAMDSVVKVVAHESGSMLLDFTDSLRRKTEREQGISILGEPDFLDHVHLDIPDYRMLALEILATLNSKGILTVTPSWNTTVLQTVIDSVMAKVDTREQGFALHNLAKVLNWAGKHEDADRLAAKALLKDSTSLEAIWSSLFVGAALERQGHSVEAIPHYLHAVKLDPTNLQSHQLLIGALVRTHQDSLARAELNFADSLFPHDADLQGMNLKMERQSQWEQVKALALKSNPAEAIRLLTPFAQQGEFTTEAQALLAQKFQTLATPLPRAK